MIGRLSRNRTRTQRSGGARVVEDSLRAAGYLSHNVPRISLVESALLELRPFHAVLAQNAWNVVGWRVFWRLLSQYPWKMRPRYIFRRMVSRINLRRAYRVVVLSEAMACLTRQLNRCVIVSPATVPADFVRATIPATDAAWGNVALVPGTVTWYKQSVVAPTVVAELRERGWCLKSIVLGGGDDGSGALAATMAEARRLGIPCNQRPLTREEMRTACSSAGAVVLPSSFESLSIPLAEALAVAPSVVARRTQVHEELAQRLARQPTWIESDGAMGSIATLGPVYELAKARTFQEWIELGRVMNLPHHEVEQ